MSGQIRGRGWGSVAALALSAAVLSVVQPVLLIFVPLALLLVGLPPRRPVPLLLALVIGWLAMTGPVGGSLWYFERGWALVLGAWFVALVALAPRWRFLSVALTALALSAGTAAAFLVGNGRGLGQLDGAITGRLRTGAAEALATWTRSLGGERVGAEVSQAVYRAAELQGRLYPAMLALASLAALGIAWWAFGRLVRGEHNPLGPLRDFRFRDELVWVLIGAIVLLLLPLPELATRAGQNLLTFMGVLYTLRGLAVLVMIGGGTVGPFGLIFGALLVVFLYPIVMATTFLVGVSDTWLDIRARRQVPTGPGA